MRLTLGSFQKYANQNRKSYLHPFRTEAYRPYRPVAQWEGQVLLSNVVRRRKLAEWRGNFKR
jgi:hypothetical protein